MHNKTVSELIKDIKNKKVSSLELTNHFIERIKHIDSQLNSFVSLTEEYAIKQSRKIDSEISKGKFRPLSGIPLAQKDIFCTKGHHTTASSNILKSLS